MDEGLFLAFICPHRGTFHPGEPWQDETGGTHTVETIELWLAPPGQNWHQFYGNPAGGVFDQSQDEGREWNAPWAFANSVEDVGGMAGGVQLYDRKLWIAEIFVPFSAFYRTTPEPGETWQANLCRDFSVPPETKRKSRDWTTWSPVVGRFHDRENFGSLIFGDSASSATQLQALGDLPNGDVRCYC